MLPGPQSGEDQTCLATSTRDCPRGPFNSSANTCSSNLPHRGTLAEGSVPTLLTEMREKVDPRPWLQHLARPFVLSISLRLKPDRLCFATPAP